MDLETFSWPVLTGEASTVTYRVRSINFANGYTQKVADGPNAKQQSFPITYVGSKSSVQAIMAFLDRHAGARAFLWTTPLGEPGLFTCQTAAPIPIGGDVFRLTATFEQAYQP